METSTEKNIATLTHLSSLTQYFIPFGNYIFPIILWSTKKEASAYVDHHGKQVLNFQLSLLLYSLLLIVIMVPAFIISVFQDMPMNTLIDNHHFTIDNFNFEDHMAALTTGFACVALLAMLKVSEFFLIIYASIKSSNGEEYRYPLSIPFIK